MHSHDNPTPSNKILILPIVLVLLSCLAGVGASAQVAAPTGASIQRLELAFWPEYDKPEVLVMYRGELDPTTLLPAQLVLPIPAEVGEPHAVAWKNAQGGLMVAQHTLDVVDGQTVLNITVPSHSFRVEYYQAMQREADRRTFSFAWPGGPGIAQLAYELQQPLGATELEVSPIPGAQGVAGDGLTYMKAELGTVAAGAASEIVFSYRKPSDALTANALAPATPPPAQTTPPTTATSTPIRPPASTSAATRWWPVYVAMALLVGLLAGIAIQRRNR